MNDSEATVAIYQRNTVETEVQSVCKKQNMLNSLLILILSVVAHPLIQPPRINWS